MIMQNQTCEAPIDPSSLLQKARKEFDEGGMSSLKYGMIKIQYDRMVKERIIKDFKSVLF